MDDTRAKSQIIIVGADHHNTLTVIRCFGLARCEFHILVHTEHPDNIGISNSRFAKDRISSVKSEESDIVGWLKEYGRTKPDKSKIIVPCSDLAAFVIDKHWNELNTDYRLPGFIGQPGRVAIMMDKMNQMEFAEQYGIPVPKSWSIQVESNPTKKSDVLFPCIIKPEVSASGRKSDISVCNNEEEFIGCIGALYALGYKQVIVQQYLKKKYEICAFGAMASNGSYDYVTVRKIRETPPPAQGSTLYAVFSDDAKDDEAVKGILEKLKAEHFNGLFDIEMLVCEDGTYLNEINFRTSGCGFGMIHGDYAIPLQWVLTEENPELPVRYKKPFGKRIQNDLADLSSRRKNRIGLFEWLKSFVKSSKHAYFSLYDFPGTLFFYKRLFKR